MLDGILVFAGIFESDFYYLLQICAIQSIAGPNRLMNAAYEKLCCVKFSYYTQMNNAMHVRSSAKKECGIYIIIAREKILLYKRIAFFC